MHKIGEKILTWIDPKLIEGPALEQLHNVAELPFLAGPLAAMPDVHKGYGATIGSVIPTTGAIVPMAVGYDKGCGMIAVRTKFFANQLPDNLQSIHDGIERRIPVSAGGYHREVPKSAESLLAHLKKIALAEYDTIAPSWPRQLGTLGSGNHFIELCLDENNQLWAVLHSGSRGIGHRLADRHIKVAKRLMQEQGVALKDRDLAYLSEGTPEFHSYIYDLWWAQEFALLNREHMMNQVMTELSYSLCGEDGHQHEIELERINCHHNFAQKETHFRKEMWITRKGAIQMQAGQRGIVPGSMSSATYIVTGLGNPQSYCSAPHGAGRKLGRKEAERRFTVKDLEKSMEGIVCRVRKSLVDEGDYAYKDIDATMNASCDLMRVDHRLKQVLNIKGD